MKALFDAIDCVLPLLEPYDAYEKCSPDHGESTGTNKNDTRHTNPIICKEKLIFIDFQKMIPRFLSQVFTPFDTHLQKRLYMATLRVSKKIDGPNQKSAPKDLSEMFWGSFWYVSRGHTTKIDSGKR